MRTYLAVFCAVENSECLVMLQTKLKYIKNQVTTTNLVFHWWARCVSLSFVRRGIRAGAIGQVKGEKEY